MCPPPPAHSLHVAQQSTESAALRAAEVAPRRGMLVSVTEFVLWPNPYPIQFAGIELQRGECDGVSYKNVRGHLCYLPSLLSTTVAGIVDIQS